MLFAIDRYQLGKEKEISATSLYGEYIANRQDRFFCPECGEPVFWRSRGGKKPDEFVHKKKTARTPECEKRVDGKSGLNFYERVGLPLYIEKVSETRFILNVSFPPLGKKLLYVGDNAYVTISTNGNERRVKLDAATFLEEYRTLIPVDFIPAFGDNYTISISEVANKEAIFSNWSDYADGFEIGGAIFDLDANIGRKKRRGDNIEPNRDYYVVARNFQPLYQEITSQRIGTIKLNSQLFNVYVMNISVTVESSGRYKVISNYLNRAFGVGLIEKTPTIVPLWPPVVDSGVRVPVRNTDKIYCAVVSGNDIPNVYEYKENSVNLLNVSIEDGGSKSVVINLGSEAKIISVDRKYVGSEVILQNQKIPESNFDYHLCFRDKEDNMFELEQVRLKDFKKELFFESNAKMDLYFSDTKGSSQHYMIREDITKIKTGIGFNAIYIKLADHFIIYDILGRIDNNLFNKDEGFILEKLKRGAHGIQVDIPNLAMEFRRICEHNNYRQVVKFLDELMKSTKIPIGMLSTISNMMISLR